MKLFHISDKFPFDVITYSFYHFKNPSIFVPHDLIFSKKKEEIKKEIKRKFVDVFETILLPVFYSLTKIAK